MAIIYKEIREEPVSLFDGTGEYVCQINNVLEWYDVRLQIKEQALEGYYFERDEERWPIDKNGRGYFGRDLFGATSEYLTRLF